jgi:allophanate hydrolase subunit 2
MAVNVIKPGLSTTVQDLGRPGYYHLGIPLSGGMDRFALRAANMLVGNDEGAAVLEAVFMGPELEFTEPATVAVTGADLPPKVNGESARPGRVPVKKGQTAVVRLPEEGRAGLHRRLGRHRRAGGAGLALDLYARRAWRLQGPALKAGDKLPVGAGQGPGKGAIPERAAPRPGQPAELRMLPGLYWHRITAEAGKRFFADTWKVAPEADRIGYRFKGGKRAGVRAARTALRRGLEPVEHRRCLLSLRLDPGAGRDGTDRAAPRCGVGRRLLHGGP